MKWLRQLVSRQSVHPGDAEIQSSTATLSAHEWKDRGNAHLARAELQSALACYQAAIEVDPSYAEAYNNLGMALAQANRVNEAETAYRRALALKPELSQAHYNLGRLLHAHGRQAEAIPCFKQAAEHQPDFAPAYLALGSLLYEAGSLDDAVAALQRAVALRPEAVALGGLALAFHQQGRLEEAQSCYRQALAIDRNDKDLWNNFGLLLEDLGQTDEALACYERALALAPDDSWRRFNLALPLLALGRLDEGWAQFEHRFASGSGLLMRPFAFPQWRGNAVGTKRLLVWSEFSVGDEVLFAGLFGDALAQAGNCVIEATPKLVPLFKRSFPRAVVVPRSDPPHPECLREIDCQVSAGGLARWLRPSLDSFPRNRGYLVPDAERVGYWRQRLGELGPGLKVGVCWRSSVRGGRRQLHYTTLSQWGAVFAVPGVHFVSLQYDECSDELDDARRRFGVALHAFPEVDLLDDLDESAALANAMDLVISAPTATSKLAAATGVATWEMSSGTAWPRLGTGYVPWLPAMRLFVRPAERPWEELLDAVAEELRAASCETIASNSTT